MVWSEPAHTRSQVDAAGEYLVYASSGRYDEWDDSQYDELDRSLSVINNWRSCHSYPLQVLRVTLTGRAKNVHEEALIAQRLKRLESISTKLQNHRHMKLSQMQDIGGCRAVLPAVHHVDELVRLHRETIAKNPDPADRPQFVKEYDYISNPKKDGYRGVHFVYKYATKSPHRQAYNGLRIEIQLRSQLQHAWATAVETVSTFTKQALKANVGTDAWKRFFALAGSAIALRERSPLIPNTPNTRTDIATELRQVSQQLNAWHILHTCGQVLQHGATNLPGAVTYLLVMDPEQGTTVVTGFGPKDFASANAEYLKVERAIRNKPGPQAVLVSVDSMDALRRAYPNYYLDTSAFVEALKMAVKA